jgi:anti-anti-sigma regulatory factor/putative methionine-R-sulfoxide reductase with GAF domain
MPLRSGGRWQGLVTFLWTEPHTFSPEERFYLRRLLEPMEAVVASRRAYLAQQVARNESERRALQLQTAAEVSYAASSILDPDELIHRVVELVRERFDLYYVGLFLVDQTGEWTGKPGKWAVLRAGTGEAGRQMVEQNHTLEVGGESMIGWCIANAQARIALDVGEEAMHFDNQLLPDTRSEMALPLLSLGQVLGAMTIQSTQEAAFSEEDIAALQTMAGQLANAIQNARLVKEAQLRVKELEQAYEKQARLADTVLELSTPVIQVWENVLVLPLIGALDASRVTRIMENLLTGIVKYQAELVILDLTGIPTVDTNTAHYLMQTIKAAGLLGAQAILTGIRPEMAQTITSLGVELRGVPILANLRAGIEYALAPRFAFNQPLQK